MATLKSFHVAYASMNPPYWKSTKGYFEIFEYANGISPYFVDTFSPRVYVAFVPSLEINA